MNKEIERYITESIIELKIEVKTLADNEVINQIGNEVIKKYEDFEENKQKEIKEEIKEIIPKLRDNSKYIENLRKLQTHYDEIRMVNQMIEARYEQNHKILSEITSIDDYITLEGINELLENSGESVYSKNTLQNWSQKGYLGEGVSEKELMPNSYTSHRTLYFEKDNVLDFLIKNEYLKPKYGILDTVNNKTVLRYEIDKNNKLIYYAMDVNTDQEEYIRN
jgi:hypothetical protein